MRQERESGYLGYSRRSGASHQSPARRGATSARPQGLGRRRRRRADYATCLASASRRVERCPRDVTRRRPKRGVWRLASSRARRRREACRFARRLTGQSCGMASPLLLSGKANVPRESTDFETYYTWHSSTL